MKLVNDTSLVAGWLVGRVPPHALSASCVVKGAYQLVHGGVAVALDPPPQLAGDDPDPEHPRALRYSGDLVPFKPLVDFLLWAKGYAPGGRPAAAFDVEVAIEGWTKKLVLVGERAKNVGLLNSWVSEPVPFTELPVSYGLAFGGESDRNNPAGRGAQKIQNEAGSWYVPRPRVLRVDEIAGDGKSDRGPAGFAPIAPDWDGRMLKAKRASFNRDWLKNEWPGYPGDFDWSYFNAAPTDQQFPLSSVVGGEQLTLRNLNKAHAELTCRLPGVRPRWFILETDEQFRELPLVLDTLQVDAEAGTIVLLWRGITPLKSRRMNEIAAKLIVQEELAAKPLPAQHYHELLLSRLKEIAEAKERKPAPAFEIPPLVFESPQFDVAQFEKELNAEIEAAKQEALASDPEEALQFDKLMADPFVKDAGVRPEHFKSPTPASPVEMAKSLADAHAALAAAHPPAASLIGPPPTAAELDIPDWAKKNIAELDALSRGEHDGEPEKDAGTDDESWTRERVQAHAAAGGSFAEQDLSGLDLSGLDLAGLDFSDTILDEAKLADVKFAKARLNRATLNECDLSGADLTGSILDEADLSETKAAQVSFRGASLVDATVIEADWTGADLQQAQGQRANLTGTQLANINARESDFSGALLDDADLSAADFRGAKLQATFATGTKAAGANFSGADLTNFRGCMGADFSGANFEKVRASSSVWNGSKLDKANYYEAELEAANFEEASLREAVFSRACMKKARLADADLSLASLLQADLFRATFEGANLSATDLRGANLFEAEFLNADLTDTKLESANLRGTKLA